MKGRKQFSNPTHIVHHTQLYIFLEMPGIHPEKKPFYDAHPDSLYRLQQHQLQLDLLRKSHIHFANKSWNKLALWFLPILTIVFLILPLMSFEQFSLIACKSHEYGHDSHQLLMDCNPILSKFRLNIKKENFLCYHQSGFVDF